MIHVALLLATIPIGELYHLLHTTNVDLRNWFLLSDRMQDVEWYVKDSGEKMAFIVLLAVWYARESTKYFKKVLAAFIFYRLCDMAMYWVDFNNTTPIYAAIYLVTGGYILYSTLTNYCIVKCKRK